MKPFIITDIGASRIVQADNLAYLRTLPDSCIDAIVTDPPYGLKFMGKAWDKAVPGVETWRECLRVLKPGGHILCFAGTRTHHRMATAIEDAGFEIRDMIAWVYGSGFPKSHDVSKAIDKDAGTLRGRAGKVVSNNKAMTGANYDRTPKGEPITAAAAWNGWGTALKPALEPITLARKPFPGTVAANVLQHGTGAINVDGCRVDLSGKTLTRRRSPSNPKTNPRAPQTNRHDKVFEYSNAKGRWPANLIHDGSVEVLAGFPHSSAHVMDTTAEKITSNCGYQGGFGPHRQGGYADKGSAARFFYCPKACKKDRDEGVAGVYVGRFAGTNGQESFGRNRHPTVKPTDLMRYLCRLVTPPGGVVLDPFMGSGSTGKAAIREGFRFIGIEIEAESYAIAEARIQHAYRTCEVFL